MPKYILTQQYAIDLPELNSEELDAIISEYDTNVPMEDRSPNVTQSVLEYLVASYQVGDHTDKVKLIDSEWRHIDV